MVQNSNEQSTLSSIIMGSNYSPRDWFAMNSLKENTDKRMSPENFEELLDTYELSRKQFCEIFGIGESTVSGWLNGKGIPETINHVLHLAVELDICGEQLLQLAEELDAAQFDPRIVKDGETYSIVGFSISGNSPLSVGKYERQPIGEVIARGIPDVATALDLVRTQSLLRTMKKAQSELKREHPRKQYFSYDYSLEVIGEVDHQLKTGPNHSREEE